ncbi:MAG: hypothetical protein JWN46_96 [Acidimicrobiales bacterium]|nr:hypothetical protein [Acidimicrobiales bacterium]
MPGRVASGLVGRRVDADLLVGTAEIAARLGFTHPRLVHDWRRRYPEFPEPVVRLEAGLVWYWPDISRWARKTGRLNERRSDSE